VAQEKFGRLESVAPGIWALISTPLNGDRTTVCNGGLVAGRSGVLAIEGFMQPAGATWLAEQSKKLTGRWPTHALVTHYHADHSNGIAAYGEGGRTSVRITDASRELVDTRNQPDASRRAALADAVAVDPAAESSIDLGDRTVRLVPKSGHTASDVVALIDDPAVVFAGDLVWTGMFPNYVDASPAVLTREVRSLRGRDGTIYVPGHGALGNNAELDRYLAMLEEVERAARDAKARGLSADEAGAQYKLPASLGEWVLFNPRFMPTAFAAWYRELGG